MTSFASSSTDSLKGSSVTGDVTRHCMWVLAVSGTRGPFLTGKADFQGRDHIPLFTRVVGGDG